MRGQENYDALIGSIYESADPDAPLNDALERIRGMVAASTVSLQVKRSPASCKSRILAVGDYSSRADVSTWENRSNEQRLEIALSERQVEIRNVLDECRIREPALRLLKRYNAERIMLSRIIELEDENYFLYAMRPGGSDPFVKKDQELFESIVAHLGTALRLRLKMSDAASQQAVYGRILDRTGIGLIICRTEMSPKIMNEAAADFLEEINLRIHGNSFVTNDSDLGFQIGSIVSTALDYGSGLEFQKTMALPGGQLILVRREFASDPVIQRQIAYATIYLQTPHKAICDVSPELLRHLFDLTRTEALIAAHMYLGRDAKEIQSLLSIKYTTLRTHISDMFVKLDCNRQSELIRRISLAMPFASVVDQSADRLLGRAA